MKALFRNCPSCQHRFVPWAEWRITRWSCMKCPACSAKLNRKFGLRSIAMVVSIISVLIVVSSLTPPTLAVQTSLFAAAFAIGYFVDLCTIELAEPKSYRRFVGYEV